MTTTSSQTHPPTPAGKEASPAHPVASRRDPMAISRSTLAALHCPYCGSSLELASPPRHSTAADGEDRVRYGVLRCACASYPVVEGIPILQQVEGLGGVVSLIRAQDERRALLEALNIFRVKWARQSRWHRFKYRLDCQRLISGAGLCFQEAVDLARKPQVFSDYLFHRYANPSFLAAIAPLSLLGTVEERMGQVNGAATGRVLDLACGAGHSSFLMQLLFPTLSVVSADHDFVSLYLAKRFVAPAGEHLCLDAEVPSPFADGSFDAVFCLDAFHYLHSKQASVAWLRRVAKPGALWLFPHLHNALQSNLVPGIPLAPANYLECFHFLAPRLFDEREILHGLSKRRRLELATQWPVSELDKSQTVTLVAGPSDLWRVHERFPALFCRDRSRLAINPIYRQRVSDGRLELTLTWPNEMMATECRGAEAVLPARCELGLEEVRQLTAGDAAPGAGRLAELVSQFVLVPLPPGYSRG